MGLSLLIEIGFLALFWNFAEWELSVMVYACVAVGFLIQLLLLKSRHRAVQWAFLLLAAVALIACEIACHVITAWDILAILFLYGAVLCLLLGAVLAVLLRRIWKRK